MIDRTEYEGSKKNMVIFRYADTLDDAIADATWLVGDSNFNKRFWIGESEGVIWIEFNGKDEPDNNFVGYVSRDEGYVVL